MFTFTQSMTLLYKTQSVRHILSGLVLLCCSGFGWSQTNDLWQRAQAQYDQGQYTNAIASINQYLANSAPTDSFHLAEVLYLQANTQYYLADYLSSLALYDQAIALSPGHPEGLNLRGMALFDRAFAEYELEEYLPAYNSTRAAEAIMSQLAAPNLDYLLSIYTDLAYTAKELGFLPESETYIARGEQLLQRYKDQLELPPGSARKEVTFAYEKALLYSTWNKEDKAQAALHQLAALATAKALNPEEQRRYAVALNAVADMYLNFRSDYPQPTQRAHQLLDQAFSALDTTRYAIHFWQFTFNRAKAFRYAGNSDRALQLNRHLMAGCPKDDLRLPFFWAQRGMIHLAVNADSAQVAFRQMLAYIHRGATPLQEDFSNFAPSTILNHTGLLVEIADEILAQESPHPELYALAAQFYRLGLRQFNNCFDGRTFNAKLRTYYEQAIGGILRTGTLERTEERRNLLQSIDNIENQLAWQRFSSNRKLRQHNGSDSLYKRQLQLRQAIVAAQRAGDAEQIQAIQDDIRQLELTHGKSSQEPAFQISDLQAQLSQKQLVLKYGRYNNDLYLFGISRNDIWIRFLEAPFDWKAEVANYLNALRQIKPIAASAELLGAFLLPKEIAAFEELFIVPCQDLANLPFHALHYQSDYLIKSHAQSYATH